MPFQAYLTHPIPIHLSTKGGDDRSEQQSISDSATIDGEVSTRVMEQLDIARLLADDTTSPSIPPTPAPIAGDSGGATTTLVPTPFVPSTPNPFADKPHNDAPTTSSSSLEDDKNMFFIALPFVAILLCFVGFRCCRNWRRKREQHLLNLRSAQADTVLGDMQMLPTDDPDAELL